MTTSWKDEDNSFLQRATDLWQRFKDGMAEVILSLAGSVGVIWGISALQALNDDDLSTGQAFGSYFEGGQVGLTVLAVAGAAIGTWLRFPKNGDRLLSVITALLLLAPIIATAFIVGGNPGFFPGVLKEGTLNLLWLFFILVHVLWLFFIMRQPPSIPNAQEVGKKEDESVDGIKGRAANRA